MKNVKTGVRGCGKNKSQGGASLRSPSGSASLTQLTQADTSGWYPRTTDPIPPARGAEGTTGEEQLFRCLLLIAIGRAHR